MPAVGSTACRSNEGTEGREFYRKKVLWVSNRGGRRGENGVGSFFSSKMNSHRFAPLSIGGHTDEIPRCSGAGTSAAETAGAKPKLDLPRCDRGRSPALLPAGQ